jgi:hypothetical protein
MSNSCQIAAEDPSKAIIFNIKAKKWGRVLTLSLELSSDVDGQNDGVGVVNKLYNLQIIGRIGNSECWPYLDSGFYDVYTAVGAIRIYRDGIIRYAVAPYYIQSIPGTIEYDSLGAYYSNGGSNWAPARVDATYITQ